jgi:hypothetical protein
MKKACTKCKTVKDISMFFRNKYKTDGRQSHCKVCHNEVTKKWRENNLDKYHKYNRLSKGNKIKSKMCSRKHRHDMSNSYIRYIMTHHTSLKPEDITDEMIEICKLNLKIKRKLGLTRKLKPIE